MFGFSSLAVAASFAALVTANHGHVRSHKHVRRDFTGQATYYQTGMGACGKWNNPSDKIVALNSAQYGGGYPGPHCGQMVRICETGTGNCHMAEIVDECPTCSWGSLDMSQSLFELFHSTDAGVFPITWTFADGSGNDKPDPPKEPEPTTTKKPKPTTTWTPEPEPTPTPTPEPEPTTSKKKKTTTSPPPETTSTPEPTTTSLTPTTTQVPTTTSQASAQAATTSAPATTPAVGSGNGSGTGSGNGSSAGGSNLADANKFMLALGQMAVLAKDGQ